jgi:hypothetical protein
MPSYPGFLGGSAPSQSVIATSERTVNFYLETIGTEGPQHKTALYPTPGQQPWITAATSGGVLTDINASAGIYADTRAFVVIGSGLYEIFANATIVRRGTVAQGPTPAQISYNGITGGQLLLASGTNAYCFALATNVLTLVLTGEATQIGMLDEYFLALNAATGKLRLSNLNDGLTWDPTQFALRSAQPDRWIAMEVNPPDIWLLGRNSGDIWFDAGTSPFPLAARTGLNIQYGIVASFSFQFTAGQGFWLTQSQDGAGLIVQSSGYGPQPISTLEVATAIAGYQRTARIDDAEALVYRMAGHTLYVLRFPAANATWQYDLTTQRWTELGSWNAARGDYDVWRPRFHLYAFGHHIVGEAQTGTLSLLDITYSTESNGDYVRRLRRGPVLIQDLQRLSLRRFELVLEAGLGLATGQGSDPQLLARFSADGGHTWGVWRSCGVGKIGQYLRRAVFTRLGSPRLLVAEIVMTDPIPWRIIDALVNNEATAGANAA